MSSTDDPPPSDSRPDLPIDLASLSDDQLALLTVQAPRELERRRAKRRVERLAFIREQMIELGFTPVQLFAALRLKASRRAPTSRRPGADD